MAAGVWGVQVERVVGARPSGSRSWHDRAAVGVGAIACVCFGASLTTDEAAGSLAYFLGSLAVTGLLWVMVRGRGRRALLMWPVLVTAGLLGSTHVAPKAAALCTGVIAVSFLFVGLTQPRWSSLLIWPLGVVALWSTLTLPTGQALVRVALASLVWVAVAELPAALTAGLRAAQREVLRLAATDVLTGVANRRAWEERLAEVAGGDVLSILFIDLDHFKRFNDEHGHMVGDELLQEFAGCLQEVAGDGTFVARWGGEEFVIAMPLAGPREARELAGRVLVCVPRSQSCSVGLATRRAGEELRSVVERADQALYRAKAAGRNRVVEA